MRVWRAGVKYRVVFGFTSLTLLLLISFGIGARTFHMLEQRMGEVNNLYVPLLKSLTQVESAFFLLESDLDKSLHEGVLLPRDSVNSVLNTRLENAFRLVRENGRDNALINEAKRDLEAKYNAIEATLVKIFEDWPGRSNYEPQLSSQRTDFRLRVKGLIQDLDRESRMISIGVQSDMNRLGIVLTLIVAFAFIATLLLSYGIAKSLKPLESLAKAMRAISEKGLSQEIIKEISELPESYDEIGTLSRESYKMAASLLDQNKILNDQKQNLERAHRDLALQNIELKKTQAKLSHSEKLGIVGKMAAQMAHEIRNPLNALNLHAELMEDQAQNVPEAMESLSLLKKEINRLISITESYLDLARAPTLKKESERVVLNDVVEELYDLYEPLFRDRGIYFTCDLSDVPLISTNRDLLAQLLGNLLKNASEAFDDYNRSTSKFVRLIAQYDSDSRAVMLSIMDNGSGIPEDAQRHIFSPFYTTKAQGTGLGLAYSKQLIEDLGGEISFESQNSAGTKFTLRIPVIN